MTRLVSTMTKLGRCSSTRSKHFKNVQNPNLSAEADIDA
jgi:hypothetical protein